MPGKIPANIRQGQLAEDLGVFFLRTFCAVADVRREDDVGIDALATLLRKDGKVLLAEETFAVQIKSASVEEIPYRDSEVPWLLHQQIPFFILTVDLDNSRFEIYTTNPIYGLFVRSDFAGINLILSEHVRTDSIIIDEGIANVYLGPPIVISDLAGLEDDDHVEKISKTMKAWVAGEIGQLGFKSLKKARIARWSTWSGPDYYGTVSHGASET